MRILIGNGGHAKVCRDILGKPDMFYLSDTGKDEPWRLGSFSSVFEIDNACFHLAIGPSTVRSKIARRMLKQDTPTFGVRSSSATVRKCYLGHGVFIGHQTHIGPGASLGSLSIINTAAIVEHDCIVGEGAFIGPGAVICGDVRIGNYAMIGAGAIVVPKMTIEDHARIPAGATVR